MSFESLQLMRSVDAIINSVGPDELSDESVVMLQFIFSEDTILSALDLIDRGNIIKYVTPWGHIEYEVIGSTATYSVMLDLKATMPSPYFCSCPAFACTVILSETHIMCKHILAARLAQQLSRCLERPAGPDDLAALFKRQFSISDA